LVFPSVPLISIKVALPAGMSTLVASLLMSVSLESPRPSWPRQRFTLATNPPPPPADTLTFTAARALPPPSIRNLATRKPPAGASFHPAGTFHSGLSEPEFAADGWVG